MEKSKQDRRTITITQQMVLEAFRKVVKGGKAGGVDGIEMREFEERKKDNLYKIWNRLSSGSYFPPPVRRVNIGKAGGGKRPLGIPTIGDRVAQMVIKSLIEERLEKEFHESSYGYRKGKSAHAAIGKVVENSRKYSWVLDVDIKGFFDNVDHELLMKALEVQIEEKWIKMYIRRWLEAGVEGEEARVGKGTPQGGVISPILSNLYLHYTIDKWFERNYRELEMVRYSDDTIFHCRTEEEAVKLKESLKVRLRECKLEMNETKTKIVYCKDYRRRGNYATTKFDFLGYTLKPRTKKGNSLFLGYDAGISKKSRKKICEELRRTRFHRLTTLSEKEISNLLNSKIRGWINYYGKYSGYELKETFRRLDRRIVCWLLNKYKKLKQQLGKGYKILKEIKKKNPNLFAHWEKFSHL